jgi:hypothetical protein
MKNKNLNKLILSKVLLLMLDHKEIGQIEIAILKKTTNRSYLIWLKHCSKVLKIAFAIDLIRCWMCFLASLWNYVCGCFIVYVGASV